MNRSHQQSAITTVAQRERQMDKAVLFLVIPLIVLWSPIAFGQSMPTLNSVVVNATVAGSSGDVFSYSYNVTNPAANTGSVWLISLDIRKPAGGGDLSGEGLTNDERFFVSTSQAVLDRLGKNLIAVGVQTPTNWNAALTVDGAVQWNASDSAPLIMPGVSLIGFQLTSRGLPGIRTVAAEAEIDFDTLPITEPANPSDLSRYKADLAAIKARTIASTITIGPTAPPKIFVAADFLRTIISYKEQAVQQGWIDNSGIATSLDAKLSAAQASLEKNDANGARNQLEALLHEVDAQTDKHLTSEAVALLKLNTQFLLSQIQ